MTPAASDEIMISSVSNAPEASNLFLLSPQAVSSNRNKGAKRKIVFIKSILKTEKEKAIMLTSSLLQILVWFSFLD
jgi:hypothetical protein